jgi:predicted enzyme related to lactoylglutathione lyase
MGLRWEAVVVDAEDPSALGRWWADVLGWEVDADDSFGVEVKPRHEGGSGPALVFVPGPAKAGKNRLHLDFHASDQQAEVDRMLGLGAQRADIGQGPVPWVVLRDPEGNEFCVLEPRE